MVPAFGSLIWAGAAAWAGAGHAFPVGAPPVPVAWDRRELGTDSQEELCVSMFHLGLGAIQRGCLEELEKAC